jgi:biotin operon repressor
MDNMNSDNYVGVNVFGAQVGLQVSGLDKPVRVVGRAVKRMLGLSRTNVNKAAKFLVAKTE